MPEKITRILWAVDPFAEDKSLQRNAAWALRSLVEGGGSEVEPVYALGAYPDSIPIESRAELLEQVQAKAQGELAAMLSRIKIPGIRPLRVLTPPNSTLRGQIAKVLDYARERGAELIVASTRARKGPGRWLMGSFAESLLLRAEVPLFLVNPWWDRASDLKEILFPTDFSDESREVFGQVVSLAQAIRGRITLYHKLDANLNPGLSVALTPFPPFVPAAPESSADQVDRRKAQALRWAGLAAKAGVRVTTFVDARVTGTPTDSILRFAKKRPGLIAMAARSGRFASAMLGSTTRQVVRAATVPVWVMRARPVAKPRQRPSRAERSLAAESLRVTEADVMSDLRDHGRKERTG